MKPALQKILTTDYDADEYADPLDDILNLLTPIQKRVIELRYLDFDNLTRKEIARRINRSHSVATQIEHKALRNLRNHAKYILLILNFAALRRHES